MAMGGSDLASGRWAKIQGRAAKLSELHPGLTNMTETVLAFWMTLVGTICWGVCFWWMHRLSSKQNSLLDQLREQGKRIEKLSRVEHDLIKEVHPQVNEIKQGMDAMIAVVKENSENHPPPPAKKKAH